MTSSKAIVAVILSILQLVELWTGWSSPGITEEWLETLLMILLPLLVIIVPDDWLSKRLR
jgi:hypothetical protein